jgi:OOP family OmpA-OmpF porin
LGVFPLINLKREGEFMKSMAKKLMAVCLILAVTFAVGVVSAEAKLIPRVDNFVILVDLSGSMFQKHAERQEVKAKLVKQILLSINERIPELGYTAAIQVFNPNETLIGPKRYDRVFFRTAIEAIPEEGRIFGNFTPLGSEIENLDKIMHRFSGKTAIIIVSDGEVNRGKDPLLAAKFINAEYTNICFDIISFADSKAGGETLSQINGLGNCTYGEGDRMLSDKMVVDNFVRDVFYIEVPDEPVALPAPEVRAEQVIVRGAYFDVNSYVVKPAVWGAIFQLVYDRYAKNPNAKVLIEGHTDSSGSESYNWTLSENRAKAVRDYFVSKGLPADRMLTTGYGESAPAISNATPEGRAINRRVVIKIEE